MDLQQHLTRQIAFSRATYGPGDRTKGVIDHIRKELDEIEKAEVKSQEWVDVVILALDGFWRALAKEIEDIIDNEKNESKYKEYQDYYDGYKLELLNSEYLAKSIVEAIKNKQNKNELRDWPDWRTHPEGKAIEHVRGKHD